MFKMLWKSHFGTKTKREKYMFSGSFADIGLVQHCGRVLVSINWHQSRFGWILGQMLWDVMPLWFLILCPRAGFLGSQQSAPPQLTHPYRTACHPHHSATALCSYPHPSPGQPWTFSPPHSLHGSSSSSPPSPRLSELCPADPIPQS